MAAFPQDVCFRLKLLRCLETAGQKVLTYTLLCGIPGKKTTETLVEYLDRLPDTSTAKYRNTKQKGKCFDKTQRPLISNDTSCSNFDISLLCKAITEACEGWDDPANHQAQTLVKEIKDTRNEVVHGTQATATEQEFLEKIDNILEVFVKTLDATKAKYNSDGVECDKKKKEVRQLVHDIREEKLSEAEIMKRSLSDLLPHFQKEADEELQQNLSRATLLDPLSFLGGHEDRRVEVQEFFSIIGIQEEKEKTNIHHLKLLTLAQDESAISSPHLILLEGDAGSGKTTFVTYTLSEYLKKSDRRMAGLDHYHLLLWVVCREETSDTLKGLVKSLLPGACSKYGKLVMPLLKKSSVFIIIDGLDETNEKSHQLLKDILRQAKDCPDFTLLSTSRPEAIEGMKANTPKDFKVSHMRLEGVSVDMRAELALRHYRCLCETKPGDEARLRQVIQEVAWRDIFRLPLNILFLVTFFCIEPHKLTTTITQTELYQKIQEWCVEKLRRRLAGRQGVPTGPSLGLKIRGLLCKFYKIALDGLIHSKLYLSDDDIEHLTDFCKASNLPLQDSISAFYSMRRVGAVEHYHAPHKGLQDFFAAWHIHGRFLNSYNPGDIRRELDSTAGRHLRLGRLKNMFSHLLGLLSQSSQSIHSVKAVEETVDLLQESEMRRTDEWLSVLEDTEPHPDTMRRVVYPRVAYHVNSRRDDDALHVRDGTVHIAATLLPLIRRRNVHTWLTRDQSGMEDLFSALGDHKLTHLYLEHHFRHPRPDASSAPLLRQAPRRDLEGFKGHLDADHLEELPKGLRVLFLVVAGDSQACTLLGALRHIRVTCPELLQLRLHVPVSQVTASCLKPLPHDVPSVCLYLSGVGVDEVEAAVKVAATLRQEQKVYSSVSFPGATLGADGWRSMLRSLKDRDVRMRSVAVPDITITQDETGQLRTLAESLLGCAFKR